MKKILVVFVIVVIIVLVGVGCYLTYSSEPDMPDVTESTFLFDYSDEPITNWNGNTHEYKFHQKITSINNQDVENMTIDVVFYNDGKLVAVKSNNINETENGSFDLNFNMSLDCDPNEWCYNVTYLKWA